MGYVIGNLNNNALLQYIFQSFFHAQNEKKSIWHFSKFI